MEISPENIHSLSDFQRKAKEHLEQLGESGRPMVITVNGKAKAVVQDAEAYQKLLDELDEARSVALLRTRLGSMRRGKKGRPLRAALAELGEQAVKRRGRR